MAYQLGLHMSPGLASDDQADRGLIHVEPPRDTALRFALSMNAADRQHVSRTKFGHTVSGARILSLGIVGVVPSLGSSVSGVVRICSKEQMVGTTTRRVIAPMENPQPRRDRFNDEHPRDAMRSDRPCHYGHSHLSVLGRMPSRHPFPASGRSIADHSGPESLNELLVVPNIRADGRLILHRGLTSVVPAPGRRKRCGGIRCLQLYQPLEVI